jgi:hypothetical protein
VRNRRGGSLRSFAAVLTAALVLGPAAVAGAHDVTVHHPRDPGTIRVTHDPGNHDHITVCDRQVDGHRTYALYQLLYDSSTWRPPWMKTGYDLSGKNQFGEYCHHEAHWSPFRRVSICVTHEGCSRWARVGLG